MSEVYTYNLLVAEYGGGLGRQVSNRSDVNL